LVLVAVAAVTAVLWSTTGGRRVLIEARDGADAAPVIAVVRAFAGAGVLAGFAGLLSVVEHGSAAAAPEALTIAVLAAALIGGASVFGGYGNVASAVAGTVVLSQIV
jgi:ABC-type xylose transport system permease subunit